MGKFDKDSGMDLLGMCLVIFRTVKWDRKMLTEYYQSFPHAGVVDP